MALDTTALKDGILDVASDPGPTVGDCAEQWAKAMHDYASAIVPASTTVSAAAATLEGALATAFATPAAAGAMESAFLAFATTIGTGMAPAFVATPPPAPVGFATQFAKPHPSTHDAAATALTSLIHGWMTTGTATPSGGGSPSPWS